MAYDFSCDTKTSISYCLWFVSIVLFDFFNFVFIKSFFFNLRIMSGVNLCLAVSSLVSGYLVESNGYFVLELYFISLCISGLICAFLLYFIDQIRVK